MKISCQEGDWDGPRWDETLGAWKVSQYEMVKKILRDPRFSAHASRAVLGDSLKSESAGEICPGWKDQRRLFSLVLREEVPGMLESYRGELRGRLQRFESGGVKGKQGQVEIMEEWIRPSCLALGLKWMGIPEKEGPGMKEAAEDVMRMTTCPPDRPEAQEKGNQALTILSQKILLAMQQESQQKTNSFFGRLMGNTGTEYEWIALGVQTFVAVCTSLPMMVGSVIYRALLRSEVFGIWRDRPDEARKAWLEEVIRLDGPAQVIYRLVLEEAEVRGWRFRRGDRIALVLSCANRDPAIFTGADERRRVVSEVPHLSFGLGPHSCIGAGLVRGICETTLEEVFSGRLKLELESEGGEVGWGGTWGLWGIVALQVVLGS